MRPLAVLLGIVMGSTVSITVGLAMTLIVFVALPEHADRLDPEFGPLVRTLLASATVAGVAAASFYGELRTLVWRRYAQLALLVVLLAIGIVEWPRVGG